LRPETRCIWWLSCATQHIHEGEFIAEFPLIPGHETVGVVAAMGPKVTGFRIGDRVAADNSELCNHCFYCRRGEGLLCENVRAACCSACLYPWHFNIHNTNQREDTQCWADLSDASLQWTGHGINLPGGFAEYCAYPQAKLFKIHNLTDVEATLIEPASCAAHGLDKIRPRLGSSALLFGAGPTGLVSATPLAPFSHLHRISLPSPLPPIQISTAWN